MCLLVLFLLAGSCLSCNFLVRARSCQKCSCCDRTASGLVSLLACAIAAVCCAVLAVLLLRCLCMCYRWASPTLQTPATRDPHLQDP